MTEVWIYEARNDGPAVYWNFADARAQQDEDNRCSVEEAIREGFEVGGSEERGFFYIDDGGAITKAKIQ